MARRWLVAVALLAIGGCARIPGCAKSDEWAIERREERWNAPDALEDLITFKNGKTWDNLGMNVEKVAEISGPAESRVLAFKALSCVECEPDLLLTVRSTAGPAVVSESYPGELTSVAADTGVRADKPYAKVRAFYGKCLDDSSTEVFVVEEVSLEDGHPVVKVIRPTETGVESARIEKLPSAAAGSSPLGGCRALKTYDRDVEN